jgi:hypothetical protein
MARSCDAIIMGAGIGACSALEVAQRGCPTSRSTRRRLGSPATPRVPSISIGFLSRRRRVERESFLVLG